MGGTLQHLFDDDLAIFMDGVVIDHAHDCHAQVTSDAKGDAKTETTHDSYDIASWKPEARAVT